MRVGGPTKTFCSNVRACGEDHPCRGRAHQLGGLRRKELGHLVREGLGRRNSIGTVLRARFTVGCQL